MVFLGQSYGIGLQLLGNHRPFASHYGAIIDSDLVIGALAGLLTFPSLLFFLQDSSKLLVRRCLVFELLMGYGFQEVVIQDAVDPNFSILLPLFGTLS